MEGDMTSKLKSFEDLIAWQKARVLTRMIYKETINGKLRHDYGVRDQIRRASVSVMSNIAEGFERGSKREFHQFLVIAKASCAEVRAQLYVAYDADFISRERFDELYELANEVARIIGGLRASVYKKIGS